ncbi:MAG: DUF1643 domain-containing protein [Eudoraea sp.]|nr:DUF1643 domain-containing protein [Eudoraea sp.]NNJ41457.1 DUF1643 domain-containing protein [Eudoraea sp.]
MKSPSKPKLFRHLEGLKISAVFSDCGSFRYLLEIETRKEVPGKQVCAIMLNPSVADETRADKSVQFLEKLMFEKASPYFENVSKLSIVNLFAYIQTRDFEGRPEQVGPLNDQYLQETIDAADIVLIAWGKSAGHQQRKNSVLEVLERYPGKTILVTKIHPSRGHYGNFIDKYQP